MSLYIKGMEMPTRCAECRLSTVHSFNDRPLCDVLVEYMSYGEWETKRLDNCPLAEIPPHGRLIEDVAVREQIDEWLDSVGDVVVGHGLSYYGELLGCIEDAPTIFEAEEGE